MMEELFINKDGDEPHQGYMVESIVPLKKIETSSEMINTIIADDDNEFLIEGDPDLYKGIIFMGDEMYCGIFRHHNNLISAVSFALENQVNYIYDLHIYSVVKFNGDNVEDICYKLVKH